VTVCDLSCRAAGTPEVHALRGDRAPPRRGRPDRAGIRQARGRLRRRARAPHDPPVAAGAGPRPEAADLVGAARARQARPVRHAAGSVTVTGFLLPASGSRDLVLAVNGRPCATASLGRSQPRAQGPVRDPRSGCLPAGPAPDGRGGRQRPPREGRGAIRGPGARSERAHPGARGRPALSSRPGKRFGGSSRVSGPASQPTPLPFDRPAPLPEGSSSRHACTRRRRRHPSALCPPPRRHAGAATSGSTAAPTFFWRMKTAWCSSTSTWRTSVCSSKACSTNKPGRWSSACCCQRSWISRGYGGPGGRGRRRSSRPLGSSSKRPRARPSA